MNLCTRYKFIAEDGRERLVKLPDDALLRLLRGERLDRFGREVRAACRILACCPRCTEPLGYETYNRLLDQAITELKKSYHVNLYTVHCAGCDDQHQLTQEEWDTLNADDVPFLCDACFSDPARFEQQQCRCRVSYGMRKSQRGPGFFSDSDPGVYTDTSRCPIHG